MKEASQRQSCLYILPPDVKKPEMTSPSINENWGRMECFFKSTSPTSPELSCSSDVPYWPFCLHINLLHFFFKSYQYFYLLNIVCTPSIIRLWNMDKLVVDSHSLTTGLLSTVSLRQSHPTNAYLGLTSPWICIGWLCVSVIQNRCNFHKWLSTLTSGLLAWSAYCANN